MFDALCLNKEILMYVRSQKNKLFSLTSKNCENGIWPQLGLK
jgi:hypothetical protein